MSFEILRMFTEKLDVSTYHEFIEKGSNIDLLVNINTTIVPANTADAKKLKINYEVVSKDFPISLSWIGVCIFRIDDDSLNSSNSINFLEIPEIRSFLDENINHLSFFINGDLPKSSQMMENKDAD